MKYRQLGKTGIEVSNLCLGTMTWGSQNTEQDAHSQLNYAVGAGINFIDCAEMYPVPPSKETYGKTEELLGTWLNKRADRNKLIIATKIAPPTRNVSYIRPGTNKLDSKNITLAIDASLKRLQTDYIDLYQVHWPERFTNFFGQLNYLHAPEKDGTPIAETLDALNENVKVGKIRSIGISNETAWGMTSYLHESNQRSLPRIASIQNPYNLLNRIFEINLSEFALRENIGLLAYSPMAFGVLSGKYLNGAKPEGSRLTRFDSYKRYTGEIGVKMTEKYVHLAKEYNLLPSQMALAFVNTRPFLTSTIIGATSEEQLESNIASIDVELPDELIDKINSLHFSQPNPCP